MKRLAALLGLAVLAAACADGGMLEDLGERSHEFVEGSTTSTVLTAETAPVTASPGVVAVETVRWFNEGIEGETISEPNITVSAVWARGNADGRFIQASPAEIDIALPGIEFPSLVPAEADWVTSQLVFDAASATLDIETAAAFGLWSVAPYTNDEGRIAVLRVGQASSFTEGGTGITSSVVDDGLNLMWAAGAYRYELFCRAPIPEDQCWKMVESAAPLSAVSPAAVPADG